MNEDGKTQSTPGTPGVPDADAPDTTNATDATNAPGALDASSGVPGAGIAWDALEARLAFALSGGSGASATTLPPYRRPWFASLIRQGREAEHTGRTALAAHCRDRLEREFAHFGITSDIASGITSGITSDIASDIASGIAPLPEAADGEGPSASRAEPRKDVGTESGGKPSRESAAAPRPPSPLEALARRREAAARARLRELLDRHAARLSPDEAAAFVQALETSGDAAAGAGASVSGLRRRLLDRLMRAARYRRQAARLAAWNPATPSGVAGPYNDHRALEELLHRITRANPLAAEWAAEFFDIYADMRAVHDAYNTIRG